MLAFTAVYCMLIGALLGVQESSASPSLVDLRDIVKDLNEIRSSTEPPAINMNMLVRQPAKLKKIEI